MSNQVTLHLEKKTSWYSFIKNVYLLLYLVCLGTPLDNCQEIFGCFERCAADQDFFSLILFVSELN